MKTSKKINYSNAAYSSYLSLTPKEKSKADKLVQLAAININDANLSNIINKLAIPGNLFSIKLSPKLRIVIDIVPDEIKVVDILNRELALNYSGHTGH